MIKSLVEMRSGRKDLTPFCIVSLIAGFGLHVAADGSFSFDESKDFLAPASSWPAWQQVLDQHHLVEQADIRTCVEHEELCSTRLRSVGHVIRRGQTLPTRKKIQLVNRFINKRKYRRDRRSKAKDLALSANGTRNTWSTLTSFLRRGGDCEDYATAKYFIMREMGFKAKDMRIVVSWDKKEHAYHARLAVRLEEKILWLENDNSIHRSTQNSLFRHVYSINEENIWDHQSPDNQHERKLI